MGEIIDLHDKTHNLSETLICSGPWEFRKAEWETAYFVQMLKSQSADRWGGPYQAPNFFSLKGGRASTIRAVFSYREDEVRMRDVYYLMGLIDCMINQVNPVLRTDLLRAMYKKVFGMKKELDIHWYGPLDQVLLPIDPRFYNELDYRSKLSRASSMKELFEAIRKGTDEMFDMLSLEYVFYFPGGGR